MDINSSTRKYALHNAVKFGGKASSKAIVGRILAEFPEWRNKPKELSEKIEQIVSEVNALSPESQLRELQSVAPELLHEQKKEKKTGLPDLDDAKKVVMRFAPSPSGPLHIGHAYVLSLNSEFCRKYNGTLYIRIEDTNPENINPESYKLIEEDAQWLTKNNVAKVFIQSDRIEEYYKCAEKLIGMGAAYICTCTPDDFRSAAVKKKACPCRELPLKEQKHRYRRMFSDYGEGEAVMRVKTSLDDPNPAMRDWPAMRINLHEHPRQKSKYRVWPLMNLAVAVDDHDFGITHTIRAKDHMDNEKKQRFAFEYLKWKMPHHLYVGRINFKDIKISASETRRAIELGKYDGWDDIRIPFLRALKRRGYSPDAFIKYAIDVGVTQNDKYVTGEEFFKNLNAFNRDVIDPISKRFFFIHDPAEVAIKGAPKSSVELDLHPDSIKGGRKFSVGEKFILSKKDLSELKEGEIARLMDLLNFRKSKNEFTFDSREYEKYKKEGKKIIHWLPADGNIKVQVKMPDGSIISGLGESSLKLAEVDDTVQFERFGFCRLDSKNEVYTFWFAHK
ncbi:glutamate--tRNA ligase [Candidatus Woesearchaeota archaeon]|nr:glutamate--tRNA ligase [Candidatus Woesearchaeota archaeon]